MECNRDLKCNEIVIKYRNTCKKINSSFDKLINKDQELISKFKELDNLVPTDDATYLATKVKERINEFDKKTVNYDNEIKIKKEKINSHIANEIDKPSMHYDNWMKENSTSC